MSLKFFNKKFFFITFLTLTLNTNAFAKKNCYDDIDFNWSIMPYNNVSFEFSSRGEKSIKIVSIELKDKEKKTLKIFKSDLGLDYVIAVLPHRQNHKSEYSTELKNIKTEDIKFATYSCNFFDEENSKKENKDSAITNNKDNSSKSLLKKLLK
jgi:hypothetical protein